MYLTLNTHSTCFGKSLKVQVLLLLVPIANLSAAYLTHQLLELTNFEA